MTYNNNIYEEEGIGEIGDDEDSPWRDYLDAVFIRNESRTVWDVLRKI